MTFDEFCQSLLAQVRQITDAQRTTPTVAMERLFNLMLSAKEWLLINRLIAGKGLVVQNGPFAGMRYVSQSHFGNLLPKLLGSYEAELAGVWRQCARRGYQRIVNVGCGEGYYAVGLARLLPNVSVVAFDSEPTARDLCRQLAELNGVSPRIAIGGPCSPDELQRAIIPATLVVCDIEGGELSLLDPALVPALGQCDLVVEAHPQRHSELPQALVERFAATHAAEIIPSAPRDPCDWPGLEEMTQLEQLLATLEYRNAPTPWVVLRARQWNHTPSGAKLQP